ncbi:HD-GYP domain-containing protein [Oceanobacillus rekensis]|uniref:HD-GYP domain-containing protein n=1 Tax=Oceanobacillus rekensis TaxID=937927 RepID=UPI000B440156|nr:HD-GYP domain-containing protein [Oceanobacillus rekensis]
MRVKPSQLVPGCVLIDEVKGKSNRLIMSKNTILNEKHIIILKKFLIESVEVSTKLSDDNEFKPEQVHKDEKDQAVKQPGPASTSELSFIEHYLEATASYKKNYKQWKNSMPIDIASIRKFIIPLLERIGNINSKEIYSLHKHVEKNDYIFYHGVAVSLISALLGEKLGFSKGEWLQIGLAGLLSDCGMARIDSKIITSAKPLTPSDWKDIKNHPTYSYRMVENLPTITSGVKLAILQHHERVDGNGYPLGITKEKIHTYAQVIAVADMYHAMTSERLYKAKQSPFKVLEEIQKEQYLKFDAKVVKCFLGLFTNLAFGANVILSDKRSGEIVFIDPDKPTRPLIRIHGSEEVIALEQIPELYIEEITGS